MASHVYRLQSLPSQFVESGTLQCMLLVFNFCKNLCSRFGLNSRFDTEFPSELTGRVAPEELSATLSRINNVLKRHVQVSRYFFLCPVVVYSVDGFSVGFYSAVAVWDVRYGP